jgi:hypothetical protein
MAEVWREPLKGRLNFEINFPRTGRKGIGKLRYQAGREPRRTVGGTVTSGKSAKFSKPGGNQDSDITFALARWTRWRMTELAMSRRIEPSASYEIVEAK